MAGIGFRIERILQGGTYLDTLAAHFYSAFLFSGPWLMSILTLFCLTCFSPDNISFYQLNFFRTTLIYIFAFSLIVSGILQLSLTRYISDKLYLKKTEAITPILNSALLITFIIQTIIGLCCLKYLPIPLVQKFFILMIYLVISGIWIVMIFLSALHNYRWIAGSFLAGGIVTVLSSPGAGKIWGLNGYFASYFVGVLTILILLASRIFIEFHSTRIFEWEIFSFLRKNLLLICMGFFYNLAIWIDKIIFWCSPGAKPVLGFLKSYPLYESATFFAYLTIIPALSIFIIHIETDFYSKYKLYYSRILEKGTLSQILKARQHMIKSLQKGIYLVVISQGIISLLAITFARELTLFVKLQFIQIPIFQISVVASYLHSLLLIAILIILYFDFKRTALFITVLFAGLNAYFTYLTTRLSIDFLGYGYAFSALISLAVAFFWTNYKLKFLEYYTFSSQSPGFSKTR